MDSFSTIIQALGGPSVVASAINANTEAVRKMARRNSVNTEYWESLIELARERRVAGITYAALTKIKPPRKRPAKTKRRAS
jgi:hypothetical protein